MNGSARSRAPAAVWLSLAVLVSGCTSEDAAPPAVTAASLPQPSTQPIILSSDPRQVGGEIMKWFMQAGYKRFQAEAMADHAQVESGFRPCATANAGHRYTYQWAGLRLRRLYDFSGSPGTCPPLDKQLAFADYELRSEAKFSCFWRATTRPAATAALLRGFGRGTC